MRSIFAGMMILLLALTAEAQQPKVRYSLAVYQPGTTTRATSVKVGQDFELALFAQDLRPEGDGLRRGVWAAYCDVLWNKNYATPHFPITHVKPYLNTDPNFTNKEKPNGIAALGAFCGLAPGSVELVEVCRVRMTAAWSPTAAPSITSASVQFNIRFDQCAHPWCDTLVAGNFAANPPEQSDVQLSEIMASGASITVMK